MNKIRYIRGRKNPCNRCYPYNPCEILRLTVKEREAPTLLSESPFFCDKFWCVRKSVYLCGKIIGLF